MLFVTPFWIGEMWSISTMCDTEVSHEEQSETVRWTVSDRGAKQLVRAFFPRKKVTGALAQVSSVSYADHIGLRPMWHYPLCSSPISAQLRSVSWGKCRKPQSIAVCNFEIDPKMTCLWISNFSKFSKFVSQTTYLRGLQIVIFEIILRDMSHFRNFRN